MISTAVTPALLGATAMSSLDWTIVVAYSIAIVGIGIAAGFFRKRGGEGGHYFLADNSLRWPVIGLAMFAANISTVHLVSLAESAYKFGLVFGNFEWMAGFTLVLLSLFFAPLYLRSRVATLPDFLERRFNRACRDWLSFISIISAIVLHIGVALYTAAWVLRGILDIPHNATILGVDSLLFFVIVLGVLTGIYTLVGGLLAVVWTESIQTVLLLVGALCVTAVGYYEVGGWHAMANTLATHPHPLANAAGSERVTWSTANFLSIARTADDASGMPWYAILLGYPVIGIWYWCCDQTIVQRVLAAKDESHARAGPLFCAALKILPVFIFVLPGTICLALVQQGAFDGAAPASGKDTYTFLITQLVPTGLKGLVVAALLAAAMQTCSAALNSTATLVAYDIVKRARPATTDKSLVRVGRITTAVATVVAIVISPIFGHYDTLFQGINSMIAYLAPPITTVFLLGVFWRGASGRAALLTLLLGGILGFGAFLGDWFKLYSLNFMITSFVLFAGCVIVMVPASLAMPEPLKPEAELLVWRRWSEPVEGRLTKPWLLDYRVLSGAIVACFVILYVVFW
jgi:SSS family solute:Na+ symporter